MSTAAVSSTPNTRSIAAPALNTRLACSPFFSPRAMLASGAPPSPTRLAKALTMMVMGKTTPSPAMARVLSGSGNAPTYMRSTRLYKRLMTCARTAGKASFATSTPTRSLPRSIFFFSLMVQRKTAPRGARGGKMPKACAGGRASAGKSCGRGARENFS